MSFELSELFTDLVRLSSESGQELLFMEYLRHRILDETRWSAEQDDYGNLIIRVPAAGGGSKTPILLAAHADTVAPGEGIEPTLDEQGFFRSATATVLGADDKAGIAEILVAVQVTQQRPAVEIVITREEEVGCLGAKHLDPACLESRIGYAVDCSSLARIAIAFPSRITLDVSFAGKEAHIATPEEGQSALRAAAAAILRVQEGRLDDETIVGISTLRGGRNRNAIPGSATLQAECRSLDHQKCLKATQTMLHAFAEAAEEQEVHIDVQQELICTAAGLPSDAQVVRTAIAAVRSISLKPEVTRILGCTDAQIFQAHGKDVIAIGYGGAGAHTLDEFIRVEDMEKAVRLIGHILTAMARKQAAHT